MIQQDHGKKHKIHSQFASLAQAFKLLKIAKKVDKFQP